MFSRWNCLLYSRPLSDSGAKHVQKPLRAYGYTEIEAFKQLSRL